MAHVHPSSRRYSHGWTLASSTTCLHCSLSFIICGNKMPTRCNRWIFIADLIACSTCFGTPLCPSSGAREYYTSGCCLSYLVLGFQVVGMVWGWGLCVRFAGCCNSSTTYRQLENQAQNTTGSNHFYNTLELLMMDIMVPETCWASNNICNKNHLLHLVGILFPHIKDDALSKPH